MPRSAEHVDATERENLQCCRWISHDARWYPLVISLDERLAAIDPDYIVHQVKEKFGTLRCRQNPIGYPAGV
jgi:hypothetical protein